MKPRRHHIKTAISTLALMLTLSAGTVFPGVGTEGDGTIPLPPEFPPIEEEIPETDVEYGIRPLSDLDEPVTLDKI